MYKLIKLGKIGFFFFRLISCLLSYSCLNGFVYGCTTQNLCEFFNMFEELEDEFLGELRIL